MSNDIPKLNTYVRSLGGKFNPYDNVSYQMRMSQRMRAGANIFAGQVNVRNMPYTYYESVQAGVDPNDTAQKAFTGVQLGLQFGESIMNLLNQLGVFNKKDASSGNQNISSNSGLENAVEVGDSSSVVTRQNSGNPVSQSQSFDINSTIDGMKGTDDPQALRSAIGSAESQQTELNASIAKLKGESNAKKEMSDGAAKKIEELNTQISEKQTAIDDKKREIQGCEEKVATTKNARQSADLKLAKLEDNYQSKVTAYNNAENNYNELKAKLAGMNPDDEGYTKLKAEVDKAKSDMDKARQEKEQAAKDLSAGEDAVAEAAKNCQEAQEAYNTALEALETAQGELEKLKEEKTQLEQQKADLEKQSKAYENHLKEIETQEKQVNELSKAIEKQKQRLAKMEQDVYKEIGETDKRINKKQERMERRDLKIDGTDGLSSTENIRLQANDRTYQQTIGLISERNGLRLQFSQLQDDAIAYAEVHGSTQFMGRTLSYDSQEGKYTYNGKPYGADEIKAHLILE